MKYFVFALLVLSVFCHDFPEDTKVQILSSENFDQVLGVKDNKPTGNHFVMMYAPWCGHCKRMIPTWDELSKEAEGFTVGALNCIENKLLCKNFGVKGFPSLFLITEEGQVYKHKSARTKDAFLKFVNGDYKNVEATPFPTDAAAPAQESGFLASIGIVPIIVGAGILLVIIALVVFSKSGNSQKSDKQVTSPRSKSEKKRE